MVSGFNPGNYCEVDEDVLKYGMQRLSYSQVLQVYFFVVFYFQKKNLIWFQIAVSVTLGWETRSSCSCVRYCKLWQRLLLVLMSEVTIKVYDEKNSIFNHMIVLWKWYFLLCNRLCEELREQLLFSCFPRRPGLFMLVFNYHVDLHCETHARSEDAIVGERLNEMFY